MANEIQLETVYSPQEAEKEIYASWERAGAFRSQPADTPRDRTFTIVIPPPNVTGALHLGHALNNTLQDILIRYYRMRGFNTLWQPGTDHAGIATQAVVERMIRDEEGKNRHDLGREELVRRIWGWKDRFEARIINQLKEMGCSCDWGRTRFTLDDGLARAVRHQFFNLFKDGLIFRGKRLVNWDTELQTAVANDEVYYETVKGHFWHIRYPVIPRGDASDEATKRRSDEGKGDPSRDRKEADDEPEFVIIATTRPETMLGDTAVAVHPDPAAFFDREENRLREALTTASAKERPELESKLEALGQRRASHLDGLIKLRDLARNGHKLRLPLVEREIPLITDEWADPGKGSGCVKITPAHDPNDYEVGQRHNLPMINVLTPDGKVAPIVEADGSTNPHSGDYEGLVFTTTGREKVVADLQARGLIADIEDHDHEVGHSDRSKTPIEPFLSDQWFVKTEDVYAPPGPQASARAIKPEPQASACANPPEPQASACANAQISRTVQSPSGPAQRVPDLSIGATLLTWTTYGTWLPGDDRGSVSRASRPDGSQSLHNIPGEPYDSDDPQRQRAGTERMEGTPVRLSREHAHELLACIADTSERHALELLAVAVMANHVHVLCQGEQHGREMLQALKGNASRHLNQKLKLSGAPRWWTKSGSRRRIKSGSDLTAAIDYVKNQEYPLLVWSFDIESGDAARIVAQARDGVHMASSVDGETPKSGEFAQAEACGSGGVSLANGQLVPGLAQAAIDVVRNGKVRIFPDRYAKSYLDWLGEKRDWCISRQLWWGHRIPVWHKRLLLTEENWAQHMAGTAGIDSILDGKWEDECATVFISHRETGRPVNPRQELMPVVSSTSGDYDFFVACNEEAGRKWLAEDGYTLDDDVLDTWFSSALWPFSTLGWPEETAHLKQYYPGSVLITSRDIITNWVARMVMFGLYAMGEVPFDHVYIHPKILDGRGETMSKSKGNGVDPVDIIQTHGADALRYTMADMTTETQDIRMPVEYVCPHCENLVDQGLVIKAETQARKSRGEKIERKLQPADCKRVKCTHKECGREFATQWANEATKKELPIAHETSDKFDIGRNFCNKLWNAARFAFGNLEGAPCDKLGIAALPPEDRWILAKLSQTVRNYHRLIQAYQYSASVKELREFFWDCLCDWYIELTKPRMRGARGDQERATAQQVLAFCLDQSLRLFHPTLPFITERLWSTLNTIAPQRGFPGIAELVCHTQLVVAPFPPEDGYRTLDDDAMVATFGELQDITRGVRELRNAANLPPREMVKVTLAVPAHHAEAIERQSHVVRHMAKIEQLIIDPAARRPKNSGSVNIHGLHIYVHDISDDEAERKRTKKALEQLEKQIAGKQAKLNNEKFLANAKPEIVEAERERLEEQLQQRAVLRAHLSELEN